MNPLPGADTALIADIRQLIDSARQRAEYGQQIIRTLSVRLTREYGRGWGEKQLRHCLRIAETFPDEEILSALRRELSWTHIKTLHQSIEIARQRLLQDKVEK